MTFLARLEKIILSISNCVLMTELLFESTLGAVGKKKTVNYKALQALSYSGEKEHRY